MYKRKRIGVLLAQAEELYQTHLLMGITEKCFELDYDCLVFSMPAKNETSRDILQGASNIFRLINFSRLDAVIIVPDTIVDKQSLDMAVGLVRENFSGPVVSLDLHSEFYPSILTDDAGAIEAVCDHLIEEHGFRIIDLMNGIPGHEHSLSRLNGYRRSLEKHGIEFDMRRVHDGDFWYYKGGDVAEEILTSELPMPQAVVCSSDTMAISLCDAFFARGINVPQQIAIAGLDSIREGRDHIPSITSAELPSKQTGCNGVEYLHAMLSGKEYREPPYEQLLRVGRSCGCNRSNREKPHSKNFNYSDGNYLTPFLSVDNHMLGDIISAENLEELIGCINWYTYQIKPFDTFYLCLNDNWTSYEQEDGGEKIYRRSGYDDTMHLCILRNADNTEQLMDQPFDKSVMLPDLDAGRDKPAVYYFTPLAFIDRSFGYTVMKYTEPRSITADYRSWIQYSCNGLECMRRQLHIKNMYAQLKSASVTDSTTGLFSRNGFNIDVEDMLSDSLPVKAMFMMADLNYLKRINDTYGHLAGDEAIKTIAAAIKSVCGENERCYRFGGDEFMIIGRGEYSADRIEAMKRGINDYLSEYNSREGRYFNVSVSLGAVCGEISTSGDVDALIRAADKKMYEDKQQVKKTNEGRFAPHE